MAKDKKPSPTQPSSSTEMSSNDTSRPVLESASFDMDAAVFPSPVPNGLTPREFALLAAKAFRSSKPDDGVPWLQEFVCRYTDTRTDALIEAVKAERYDDAATMLEFTAGHI